MPTQEEVEAFRNRIRALKDAVAEKPTGKVGGVSSREFGIGKKVQGEGEGPSPLEAAAEYLVGTDTGPFAVARHLGGRTLEAAGRVLGLLGAAGENVMASGRTFGEIIGRPETTLADAASATLKQLLFGTPRIAYERFVEGKPSEFSEISRDVQKFVPETRYTDVALDPLVGARGKTLPRWMPGGILTWIGEGSPTMGFVSLAGDPTAFVGAGEVAQVARSARKGIRQVLGEVRKAPPLRAPLPELAKTAADDVVFARIPPPSEPVKISSPITDPRTGYPIFRESGVAESQGDLAIILGGAHPKDIPGVQQRAFIDAKISKAAQEGKLDELKKLYNDPDASIDRYARQRIAETELKSKPPAPELKTPDIGTTHVPHEIELEEYRPSQREFYEAHAALEQELAAERELAQKAAAGAARLKAAQAPVSKPPFLSRLSQTLVDLKNKATRTLPSLDEKKHGAVVDAFRQLEHAGNYAADRAERTVETVLSGMDASERELFNDAVVAADFEHDIGLGKEIPFFDTPEAFHEFHGKIKSRVEASPNVRAAMDKRARLTSAIKEDLIERAGEIGLDYTHLRSNPAYFRHLVREHLEERFAGRFGKAGRPTGGGYLKSREGTTKEILANYAQAEYEVLNRMLRDTEMARFIRKIGQSSDIRPALEREASALGKNWEDIIPDDYTKWNPGGSRVFDTLYPADYKVTEDVLKKAASALGVEPKTMENLIGRIGGGRDFVLPRAVVEALETFKDRPSRIPLLSPATSAWKAWIIGNPWTALKYNVRNLLGDAEAVAVGNPSAFRKVGQASREIWNAIRRREVSDELQEWMRRGGFSSTQTAQELGDLASRRGLATVGFAPESKIATITKAPLRLSRELADARESILRYAAYLDYLDQIKSAGKPKNYGASIREAVDAISDPRDKAAKLANDLIGAYDQVTHFGKNLRANLIPFYSWMEVNTTRSYRMLANAWENGELSQAIGRKLGMKGVRAAAAAGSMLLKMSALTGAVTLWNKTVQSDVENELPDYIRNVPHITLGRNREGEPRYLTGISAFGDLLGWFRIESTLPMVREWLQGRAGLGDVARHAALSPLNRVAQGANPLLKAPVEAAFDHALYPDAFNPRKIRDTAAHLFEQINLDEEYKLLAGIPQRPYAEKWKDLLWNSIDPGKGDYDRIMEAKRNYVLNVLKRDNVDFGLTKRGNALYYYKLAVRYGHDALQKKWLERYKGEGGTPHGLQQSFTSMHPLYGLTKTEQQRFLESLAPELRHSYGRAIQFYKTTLHGKPFSEADVPKDFSPPQEFVAPPELAPRKTGGSDIEEFRRRIRQEDR